MNIRTLLILILIVLVVFAGAWYFLFIRTPSGPDRDGTIEPRTFSPFGLFGRDSEDVPPRENGATEETDTSVEISGLISDGRARKLVSEPVAGATFVEHDGELAIRYTDRATGHISDVFATSSRTMRVTNTTVPRIQHAIWGSDTALALQYFAEGTEILETFLATVVAETATSSNSVGSISGIFLPQNILGLDFNNDGSSLLYLTENTNGGLTGTVRDVGASLASEQVAFSSPLRELVAQWGREETVTLTTKASSGIPGQLFTTRASVGGMTHELVDMLSLSSNTSPDAQTILYTASNRGGGALVFHNRETGEQQQVAVRTLPEKCAWNNTSSAVYCGVPRTISGNLPDAWYQGLVSFNDSLVKISKDGSVEAPISTPEVVDVSHPRISPDESHLLFVNKRDLSLWLVPLPTPLSEN